MSDTHAQTAKVQAEVARADAGAGKPHIPPGHVEANDPAVPSGAEHAGDHRSRPFVPWFTVGAIVLIGLVAFLIIAT